MRERQMQRAEQIGIHDEQAAGKTKHESDGKKPADETGRLEAFRPKRSGQHGEAEEREHVPVRRRFVVDRKQEIKGEDRQPEPEKVKNFELLPGAPPIGRYRPGEREKKDR